MALFVPLVAIPNQFLTVALGGQVVQLRVYQRTTGLFIDVSVSNVRIIGGVLCLDRNRIVRDAYLGFQGDFAFVDQQGTQQPDYTGLGSRYLLVWYAPGELPPP